MFLGTQGRITKDEGSPHSLYSREIELAEYPDVAEAIRAGQFPSGLAHFVVGFLMTSFFSSPSYGMPVLLGPKTFGLFITALIGGLPAFWPR
jgi:hypothetical protein